MRNLVRFFIFAIAAIGVVALVPTQSMAQSKKHPSVRFVSGTPTGTWFPSAAAIAEMANAKYDGQPISVITGAGGVGNPAHTGAGKSGLGISYGPFLALAKRGEELYKTATPTLCAIGAAPPNLLHMIMDAKFSMDTFANLKSNKTPLKIATGATGSTEQFVVKAILKEFGVTFKDIEGWGGRVDFMRTGERVNSWKNRQVDVVNSMMQPPHSGWIEMMTVRKSRLLALPEKVRDALAKKWGFQKLVIPGGLYPNHPDDVKVIGLPFVVYADTRAVSQELIYDLTAGWATGKDRMVKAHAAHKKWTPSEMGKGLGIAPCEATARYYKEQGWK
jgi:uncharacterized protein